MTITARPTWTTSTSRPDHPDAVLLLREYMTEMVVRYHRRPALPGEVDAALAEMPSDDLTAPSGLLLLAHHGTDLAGCAGLRWQSGWAELTRVFVRSEHRGAGGGAALLAAVEEQARAAGAEPDPARHPARPGRGPRPVRPARLRRDPGVLAGPLRRALVREAAVLTS